jgi:hypothetical protein
MGCAARHVQRKTDQSFVRVLHDDACTNQAESFFSRLRRAEVGIIRRRCLHSYASEMAWRENHRRAPNGTQYLLAVHAATHYPVSRQWKSYWQRSAK